MHIAVELSLYPLSGDFIPPIQDFIERLNAHPELRVVTNALSTQVSGELERVFTALAAECGRTFAAPWRSVFVMKVLGGGD
ncbi:MAG: hypothetical protein FJ191_05110 [Gammaproteobacteria bacterium]|nr:hypothetical protein [Gammaproteobacteria bacterium]